jgi:hypothetical protein
MVLLGRRAQRVIAQINAAADKLRHELLAGIPRSELQTCIKVLVRISQKAEKGDKVRGSTGSSVCPGHNGQERELYPITKKKTLRGAVRGSK